MTFEAILPHQARCEENGRLQLKKKVDISGGDSGTVERQVISIDPNQK